MKLVLKVSETRGLAAGNLVESDQVVTFGCSASSLTAVVKMFANGTFNSVAIELEQESGSKAIQEEREIIKQVYLLLKDESTLSIKGIEDEAAVVSQLKLAGFTETEVNGGEVRAKKAKWQAAGAPLKRKQPEVVTANPWASLQTNVSLCFSHPFSVGCLSNHQ